MTKKGKPSKAHAHGISWFAEPSAPPNVVSAEADWEKLPILAAGDSTKAVIPVHDETNHGMSRLLLKMGIELISVFNLSLGHVLKPEDWRSAKDLVLGVTSQEWPYFLLLDGQIPPHMVSVFKATPEEHQYIRTCGFDLFLHLIEPHTILGFQYGAFAALISLASRSTEWISQLKTWNVRYVGCPQRFERLQG